MSECPVQLKRQHLQRLREIHRTGGWPAHDMVEVSLLAAQMVTMERATQGHEVLRLTELGIATLAQAHQRNVAARCAHEDLVDRVAQLLASSLAQDARLVWRNLELRVAVPRTEVSTPQPAHHSESLTLDLTPDMADKAASQGSRWAVARPDVYSIRQSSVQAYLEPWVHEIKVSRADLLGDVKKPDKRAAYLASASACWYVLGSDAKGRCIGTDADIPPECGLMVMEKDRLLMVRDAPRRAVAQLDFQVWMALAKATPEPQFHAEWDERQLRF